MPEDLHASMSRVPAGAVMILPSTVSVTSGIALMCSHNFLRGDDGGPGFVALDVVFKLFTELSDEGQRGHGRGVAKRAEGASQHVLSEKLDTVDILLHSTACMDAVEG